MVLWFSIFELTAGFKMFQEVHKGNLQVDRFKPELPDVCRFFFKVFNGFLVLACLGQKVKCQRNTFLLLPKKN